MIDKKAVAVKLQELSKMIKDNVIEVTAVEEKAIDTAHSSYVTITLTARYYPVEEEKEKDNA